VTIHWGIFKTKKVLANLSLDQINDLLGSSHKPFPGNVPLMHTLRKRLCRRGEQLLDRFIAVVAAAAADDTAEV
jgi:hypothetical protein